MSDNSGYEEIRRKQRGTGRNLIQRTDIATVFWLAPYTLIAWLVPQGLWPVISSRILSHLNRKGPSRPIIRGLSNSNIVKGPDRRSGQIDHGLNSNRILSYLQYLKDYRWGGWTTQFDLRNESELKQRQAAGKGAVLWIAHFVFNGLPLKKGLCLSNIDVTHLSRPEHGFSTSQFGVRFLNPIRSNIELRYLATRILIQRNAEHLAVRKAYQLVKSGETVSFTAGAWEGNRIAKVPFGGGLLPIATGAPALAYVTGVPLFPVFIVRSSMKPETFRIVIGPDIAAGKAEDRATAVRQSALAFAAELERLVSDYPDQWRGWKYLEQAEVTILKEAHAQQG